MFELVLDEWQGLTILLQLETRKADQSIDRNYKWVFEINMDSVMFVIVTSKAASFEFVRTQTATASNKKSSCGLDSLWTEWHHQLVILEDIVLKLTVDLGWHFFFAETVRLLFVLQSF